MYKFYCLIDEGENDRANGDGPNLRPALIIQDCHRPSSTMSKRNTYLVNKPLDRRRYHSDNQTHWNNPIWPIKTVKLLCKRPCNGGTVKTLGYLPAPNVGSHRA